MSDEAKSLIVLVVNFSPVPSGRNNQITPTRAPCGGGINAADSDLLAY